jgi:hypothetical protein
MSDRVIQQHLAQDGVITTYADGRVLVLPYLVDEDGSEYVDIDPNNDVFMLPKTNQKPEGGPRCD